MNRYTQQWNPHIDGSGPGYGAAQWTDYAPPASWADYVQLPYSGLGAQMSIPKVQSGQYLSGAGYGAPQYSFPPRYTSMYPDRGVGGYGQGVGGFSVLQWGVLAAGVWSGWRLLVAGWKNEKVRPRFVPSMIGGGILLNAARMLMRRGAPAPTPAPAPQTPLPTLEELMAPGGPVSPA